MSPSVHSVIKNVFQGSLEGTLGTHKRLLSCSTSRKSLQILHRPCLMFSYTIYNVQSHLMLIEDSRISSKTPLKTLRKHIRNWLFPVCQETKKFGQSFPAVCISHCRCPQSSRPHSGIKNVLQDTKYEKIMHTSFNFVLPLKNSISMV